ncbi:hypothetical protein FSARC_13179, partial [Fusarium sarcochroum]
MAAPRRAILLLLSAVSSISSAARVPKSRLAPNPSDTIAVVNRLEEQQSIGAAGPQFTILPVKRQETSFVKNNRPNSAPQPSKTDDGPEDPPVSSETGYTETIITGTDGAIVTFVPTQNTEWASITSTVTTTDEDGDDIIVFPGGWWWWPKGPQPPNPPKPPPSP